jgi:hypothetical protein
MSLVQVQVAAVAFVKPHHDVIYLQLHRTLPTIKSPRAGGHDCFTFTISLDLRLSPRTLKDIMNPNDTHSPTSQPATAAKEHTYTSEPQARTVGEKIRCAPFLCILL